MKIVLAYTPDSKKLAENIKVHIENIFNQEVEEIVNEDIYELSIDSSNIVLENIKENRAIIIDDYGIAPFMICGKRKYIICSETNDEHTALMTRDHNNSNIITIGYKVVGKGVALSIVDRFIDHEYAGGRHQIRVDMLNKM